MEENKLIIVTGFGPFVGHELVNASWEAVRLLPNDLHLNNTKYKIEKILASVEYEKVDKAVDEIWKKNPELVIHCGVHGSAKCIQIEKVAYNHKFCRPDYTGKLLECSTVILKNHKTSDKLSTKFDIKKIISEINDKLQSESKLTNKNEKLCENQYKENNSDSESLICSLDVGNYLCGYIYLKSLDINDKKCLFIHVPPINKPFTSEETSELIYEIIQQCLEQLNNNL